MILLEIQPWPKILGTYIFFIYLKILLSVLFDYQHYT